MVRLQQSIRKPPQGAEEGVGPLYHRVYWIDFITSKYTLDQIVQTIKAEFANYSPQALLEFEKSKGRSWDMRVGDEYNAQLVGGLKGSVRVVESDKRSFTFVSLKGHPEAGKICFAVDPLPDLKGGMRFSIESWARSRDGLVQFAYEGFNLGRFLQRQVWSRFCLRVLKRFEGRPLDKVVVITRVLPGVVAEALSN